MSKGPGIMTRAICATWDALQATRDAEVAAGQWDDGTRCYIPQLNAELVYPEQRVFDLDTLRRQTYALRRRHEGVQHDYNSHATAFSRAFVRLCREGYLQKVWPPYYFTTCPHCKQALHPPYRDASVVQLRKW